MSASSTNITLPNHQWEWLQTMTEKHNLSSISKAVRICITCVAVGDVSIQDATMDATSEGQEKSVELTPEQISYVQRNDKNTSQFIQQIINACASAEEYTVFGIIRCKTSIAECEGAIEAVKDVGGRYGRDEVEVLGEAKENIQI